MNAVASEQGFYQPLKESRNEIRLVHLSLKSLGNDEVQCHTEVVSLGQDPQFFALSYEWEASNESSTRSVTIVAPNGQKLRLRPNLSTFLRHLAVYLPRAFKHCRDSLEFWIDSICIDQDNIEERASQVRLMSRIYQNAVRVYAWLGMERDQSSAAIDTIPELVKHRQRWRWKFFRERSQSQWHKSLQSKDWTPLIRLLERTYWGRGWIAQELALGRCPYLLCGEKAVTFLDFSNVMHQLFSMYFLYFKGDHSILKTDRFHWAKRHPDLIPDAIASRIEESERIARGRARSAGDISIEILSKASGLRAIGRVDRDHRERDGSNLSLIDCLLLFRNSKTADPRDKVYAFMGLADPTDIAGLKVDYSVSWQEVYRRACEQIISSSRSLDVLISCGSATAGLPTWVPNWSDPAMDYHFGHHTERGPNITSAMDPPGTLQLMFPPNQFPGASLAPADQVAIKGNLLAVRATYVATIHKCHVGSYGSKTYSADNNTDAQISFLLPDHSSISADDKDLHDKLHKFGISKFREVFLALPITTATMLGAELNMNVLRSWMIDGNPTSLALDRQTEILSTYLFENRTIFKIIRPHQICDFKPFENAIDECRIPGINIREAFGICRVRAQEGDEIHVLHGCRMPLVLRPHATKPLYYSLIGAAWVIGLMNQEAVGKLYETDITLV